MMEDAIPSYPEHMYNMWIENAGHLTVDILFYKEWHDDSKTNRLYLNNFLFTRCSIIEEDPF